MVLVTRPNNTKTRKTSHTTQNMYNLFKLQKNTYTFYLLWSLNGTIRVIKNKQCGENWSNPARSDFHTSRGFVQTFSFLRKNITFRGVKILLRKYSFYRR